MAKAVPSVSEGTGLASSSSGHFILQPTPPVSPGFLFFPMANHVTLPSSCCHRRSLPERVGWLGICSRLTSVCFTFFLPHSINLLGTKMEFEQLMGLAQ